MSWYFLSRQDGGKVRKPSVAETRTLVSFFLLTPKYLSYILHIEGIPISSSWIKMNGFQAKRHCMWKEGAPGLHWALLSGTWPPSGVEMFRCYRDLCRNLDMTFKIPAIPATPCPETGPGSQSHISNKPLSTSQPLTSVSCPPGSKENRGG